ncbi:peptidoglycan DD-metalloendopeptidase family protein [Lentibacillus sp.]|uniref:peptidoglycan DD-metalloendopeptidase family protein n=1 Tax=Lentibacillus sp. TaxID=1925746 RepID=UPI002B4AB323|nr:peptidoglycan DD-metalloendopeptidase family protein [Lentibacillus sp.]HLS09915.1 peptidoglycan DD-metalloendopeptidase family protein [Lentibacillus sp.]
MKEENNGTPKNKWSRIFRKKWFFPAVYLTIAALLLSLVIWYQNLGNQIDESQEEENTEDYTPVEHDEDARPVMDQQEVIQAPVENMDQAEIVTKYFDYNADQEDQENAIVVFNDRYYQSTGIDIASADGETFDVLASLSGTVTEVKEDPLLGNVVTITHANDVTTHYASLGDVQVSADSEVEQGDAIGTAGENLFGKDNGTHLHFEIRKDGEDVNPEDFFNQPMSALDEAVSENDEAENENAESDGSEHESDQSEATEEDNSESDATEEEDTDSESDAEEDSESDQSDNDSPDSGENENPDSGENEDDAMDSVPRPGM